MLAGLWLAENAAQYSVQINFARGKNRSGKVPPMNLAASVDSVSGTLTQMS
jgi:hypothetical protein